ncbi:MAG TPA: ABC transporter ATP-binding protein [Bacteroidaceae bacterium]|nr:ABC transporter ATP-binding protein [Bacteroidaceae bacterium]
MTAIIKCTNLTHKYGKRVIYENLSFEVPQGRILGLLGKNGTGKTTTINILSGFLKPQSGECSIFGHDLHSMPAALRANIGLLIEGHIQYQFMTIEQIEKFYSQCYPNQWKRDAYYDLMSKLKVAPKQRISRMSCGQRSQVALGLILAQDPELLVLDDFSLGLDPGYRRLFVDYLRDYAKSENKTVFLTSHIIQDMERLIDDCIIMDYGSILLQQPVNKLLDQIRSYQIDTNCSHAVQALSLDKDFFHPSYLSGKIEWYSFLSQEAIVSRLQSLEIPYTNIQTTRVNLEDAFIGLTGKY